MRWFTDSAKSHKLELNDIFPGLLHIDGINMWVEARGKRKARYFNNIRLRLLRLINDSLCMDKNSIIWHFSHYPSTHLLRLSATLMN